jgi:hypothetical protein
LRFHIDTLVRDALDQIDELLQVRDSPDRSAVLGANKLLWRATVATGSLFNALDVVHPNDGYSWSYEPDGLEDPMEIDDTAFFRSCRGSVTESWPASAERTSRRTDQDQPTRLSSF